MKWENVCKSIMGNSTEVFGLLLMLLLMLFLNLGTGESMWNDLKLFTG